METGNVHWSVLVATSHEIFRLLARNLSCYIQIAKAARLQNTGPLIYSFLKHKGTYCVMLRSSKDFDKYKTDGPKEVALHSVVSPRL